MRFARRTNGRGERRTRQLRFSRGPRSDLSFQPESRAVENDPLNSAAIIRIRKSRTETRVININYNAR